MTSEQWDVIDAAVLILLFVLACVGIWVGGP